MCDHVRTLSLRRESRRDGDRLSRRLTRLAFVILVNICGGSGVFGEALTPAVRSQAAKLEALNNWMDGEVRRSFAAGAVRNNLFTFDHTAGAAPGLGPGTGGPPGGGAGGVGGDAAHRLLTTPLNSTLELCRLYWTHTEHSQSSWFPDL